MDKTVVLYSCVRTGNTHNGKIATLVKRIHLHVRRTQKPVSIYPKNVLLQSHEILHFVVISDEYPIFKCVSNVTILFLLCPWHRHVVVSDKWFSSAHHTGTHISTSPFLIVSFLCVQSYRFVIYQLINCNENESPSSPREISTSYFLHEVELPPSPWKF